MMKPFTRGCGILIAVLFTAVFLQAQEDLLSLLEEEETMGLIQESLELIHFKLTINIANSFSLSIDIAICCALNIFIEFAERLTTATTTGSRSYTTASSTSRRSVDSR